MALKHLSEVTVSLTPILKYYSSKKIFGTRKGKTKRKQKAKQKTKRKQNAKQKTKRKQNAKQKTKHRN